MHDRLKRKRTPIRGPRPVLRILGALSIAFTFAGCGGGSGSSWYNPMDWFGSDEEEAVSEDQHVAGDTVEDGLTGG